MASPSDTDLDLDPYLDPERLFIPQSSALHRLIPANRLIINNAAKGIRHVRAVNPYTGQVEVDESTVVVAISGNCPGIGTSSAQGLWGAYFGPESSHNSSGVLAVAAPQTVERAEIEALKQALIIIRKHISRDLSLQKYLILTDSSYLIEAFAGGIRTWIDNDWTDDNGQIVPYSEVLIDVDENLNDMTYGHDGGMDFKFWMALKGDNREAVGLANGARDQCPQYQ
ncbi:ribonuclease H-like protein [Trichoderma cornu-damae]|uniref:Ribonuclease H-like protein n=1 Tax=Trichoderma cornu-damae TaxID=654480 RepID=A0A9P8QL98_9HYPO|nr:ribonuclease H-like protein [Trichoderma cornu-damae]